MEEERDMKDKIKIHKNGHAIRLCTKSHSEYSDSVSEDPTELTPSKFSNGNEIRA